MHKCITDVIYYIVCISVSVSLYLLLYMFVYTIFNRFRIACAAADGWELCNAHQMATVCSEAIKLWGPQFKQSSPKSTHTQAQTKRRTHTITHTHTKRDTRSSDRRQSAVEMRVVSVELCQKVALKTSVHKAAKRGGASLM